MKRVSRPNGRERSYGTNRQAVNKRNDHKRKRPRADRNKSERTKPASFIGDQLHLESRLVIVGFIRKIHEMDYIVPEDIVQLCASFYLGREFFACHGGSYHLDLDRTTITKMKGRTVRQPSHFNISFFFPNFTVFVT